MGEAPGSILLFKENIWLTKEKIQIYS